MHFALHLRIGAGIRYILDFYYLFKKTNINIGKLHILIQSNGLDIVYSNVINGSYLKLRHALSASLCAS